MAEFGNPDVVQEECDVLMIGGGMANCGAAYEIGPWAEKAEAGLGRPMNIMSLGSNLTFQYFPGAGGDDQSCDGFIFELL